LVSGFQAIANGDFLPAPERFFTRRQYADSEALGSTIEGAWHIIGLGRTVRLDPHSDRLSRDERANSKRGGFFVPRES
jgi:hypothetical protein